MTITVKKAGQAAVKAAGLTTPRAVSATETVAPARKSTTQTMMPWNQWFQRFVQETMGQERYRQMKETFWFMPVRVAGREMNIYYSFLVPL